MSKYNHKNVGSVFDIKMSPMGSFVYILAKRENPSSTPIVIGQFLLLVDKGNPDRSYFCIAEEFVPDLPNSASTKDVLKNSQESNQPIDDLYKSKMLYLAYKCRLLGICKDEDGKIKYYSSVRSLPDFHQLSPVIPSPEFMKKLFLSAVEASDNDDNPIIFELGYLKYGTNPDDTDCYPIGTDKQVQIQFNVSNLLRKRTAIFGKSGYGKSNTTKTVIGMIAKERPTCGQLILDTNGEYARDNLQNKGFMDIFHEAGMKDKTVLYTNRNLGTSFKKKYGEDSVRTLKFDVFKNIRPAFEIVEANLQSQRETPIYLQPWLSSLGDEEDGKIFLDQGNPGLVFGIYYRCLISAGLSPVTLDHTYAGDLTVRMDYLDFKAIRHQRNNDSNISDGDLKGFKDLPESDQKDILSTLHIARSSEANRFICRNVLTMADYASWYIDDLKAKKKEDSSVKGFAELLLNPRRLYALKAFHLKKTDDARNSSLGDAVFEDLKRNRIVMLDLSSVPMKIAKSLSRHICANLLNKASSMFGDDSQRTIFSKFDVIVYIEESQNYLSKEELSSGNSIYERLAKEGRKFHLGLVYVTQQPSAIDFSVTSQTENIIALHMSNETDCLILNKIKDKFDLLTCKFLKDEAAKGLSYCYSEPHQPFVLPCQIKEFNADFMKKNK
jgi:ABC-type oligopeptide transport system ATPase subunit